MARWVRLQKPSQLWGIRVRVAQGPSPQLTLERAVYCPPAVLEGSLDGARLVAIEVQPSDHGPSNGRGRVTVRLEVRVSDDGLPITVNITQSTGFQEFDEQIVQQWRGIRFHPALLDGLPVEAWYKTDGQSPRL
jgi:TonB family protein